MNTATQYETGAKKDKIKTLRLSYFNNMIKTGLMTLISSVVPLFSVIICYPKTYILLLPTWCLLSFCLSLMLSGAGMGIILYAAKITLTKHP